MYMFRLNYLMFKEVCLVNLNNYIKNVFESIFISSIFIFIVHFQYSFF